MAVSIIGLVLAGCSGGSSDDASPAPSASSSVAGWTVDATQDAAWTQSLADLSTQSETAKGEAQIQLRTEVGTVAREMGAAGGPDGIGHVVCVALPVQMKTLSGRIADDQEQLAQYLGAFVDSVLVEASAGEARSFADAQLDAKVRAECPDVRQDVIDATGVTSLDDLYEAAGS
ncbi:hypothetical protein [Kineosporia succinea]|uniref:Lipoprotein n=1 Tax=Kineosporia succinea TaxID=84632 RepID=A0ABT9P876_9ACTN|nr:hypothetical protein [Kineosporia succinea]MDP9828878.1 hypothetical protein [Kineosporia succinea]